MTTTYRDAITSSVPDGSLIYNTTTGTVQQKLTGAWEDVGTGGTTNNGSTTVAGKFEEATQAELNAGTLVGGTGADLVVTPPIVNTLIQNRTDTYATSTGSANAFVLTLTPAVTSLVAGQEFEFKANFTPTGACTLNVNGLGAKNIFKLDGATAIAQGDIVTNQAVKVKYDGTQFQMLNPVANIPALNTDLALSYSYTVNTLPTNNLWYTYTVPFLDTSATALA